MDCVEFSRQWRFDTTEPDALLEMIAPRKSAQSE
jgi:hypothetical protein